MDVRPHEIECDAMECERAEGGGESADQLQHLYE